MNPPSSILHPLSSSLDEATILQWTWKTDAMRRMAVAICKLALERAEGRAGHSVPAAPPTTNGAHGVTRPTSEFSANDLPEFEHGGGGIAGVVFNRLAKDEVLSPVGWFDHEAVFHQTTVKNAGGNHIGLWRLASAPLARALLKAHGQPVAEMKQAELLTTDH